MTAGAVLCPSCVAEDEAWLDAITPSPHRPYPWEPQPIGRFRVQDADNRHARSSRGAQMLRVVRSQRRLIWDHCARAHQPGSGS